MKQQRVILIAGMPGAGKTTLVKELQAMFPQTVAISIDLIQESLYDSLGFISPNERRRLRVAAFKIALDEAVEYMKQGLIPLLEYPFGNRHKEALIKYFENMKILTLRLDLPIETAYQRFHQRDLSGERHPGHYFLSYPPKDGDKPRYQPFVEFKQAMDTSDTPGFELGDTLKISATDFPLLLPVKQIQSFLDNDDV